MIGLRKCLLIIDVQEAMFLNEEDRLADEKNVIENIKKMIKTARKKGIPIVYVKHTENEGLYKKGENSWQIYNEVAPLENDKIVEKSSWDSFLNTKLKETLDKIDVNELIIAGMQTEFCLDTSIRSGYEKGYKLTVAKDAHSTFDSDVLDGKSIINHHNNIWGGRFAELKLTNDIIGDLERAPDIENSNIECDEICYELGKHELLDRVEPLWYELNSHHEKNSKYFKEKFKSFEFNSRKKSFEKKKLWVKIVVDKYKKQDIGYLIASVDDDSIGEIESLYLKSELRGKRIGEKLMKEGLDWVRIHNPKKIVVGVSYGNERTFKFYSKFGFYPRVILLSEK
jgi:nicotinamidase-related amidase/ribosomal protein S18 acetylase RimI-like enzyme